MPWFFKKQPYAIGIDLSDSAVRAVQFKQDAKGIALINAGGETCPESIHCGTYQWQEWVGQTIERIVKRCELKGKNVVMAMPANEVFIDHLKKSKSDNEQKLSQDAVLSKIKNKLPFPSENALLKTVETENLRGHGVSGIYPGICYTRNQFTGRTGHCLPHGRWIYYN